MTQPYDPQFPYGRPGSEPQPQPAQPQPAQPQPVQTYPVQPGQPYLQQPVQPAPYGYAPLPQAPLPHYRSYHLQGRNTRSYRWWKPLVAALLAGVLMTVFQVILIVVGVVMDGGNFDGVMSVLDTDDVDYSDPVAMLVMVGSIAVMIPAVWIAIRLVEGRSFGTVSSVAGRLRWGLLLKSTGVSIVFLAIPYVIDIVSGEFSGITPVAPPIATILIVLIVTPFQCAAEEYAFRGFLMQAVGGWTRLAWLSVLITIPIFTLGHTQYGWKGLVDVGVFAIAMGWLVIRTGGLEASIALHVVNNTTGFMLGAFALVDPMDDTSATIPSLLFSAAITIGYTAFIDQVGSRLGWFELHPIFTKDPADDPRVAEPAPVLPPAQWQVQQQVPPQQGPQDPPVAQ